MSDHAARIVAMDDQMTWSVDDSAAATREGWDLFECSGSEHGDFQLQRFDFPSDVDTAPKPYPFEEDDDVWRYVRTHAAAGSPLHRKALNILRLRNPAELARIEEA